MSQTKEAPEVAKTVFDKEMIKQIIYKNKEALKVYWPLLLLTQLPVLVIYLLLAHQKPVPQTSIAPDQKTIEQQRIQNTHIKNIEQRFNELNQRFVVLQSQHAKMITSLISFKTAATQQSNLPPVNLVKRTTLETLDRIGEKIRLNEPFSGLLANLPKDCSTFSGYKTLQQFSARLPLTFIQLKKTFDDIKKGYIAPKANHDLPNWLEKIAAAFKGTIKIEKANQIEENPLQPIADALEVQDLRLAYSFTKDIQIQSIKQWAKLAMERILLEEDYSTFAEKVQSWVNQTPPEANTVATNTPQEILP